MKSPSVPPDEIHVHVHHPDNPAGISLRTSADWDTDILPDVVDVEAGRCEFRIATDEPFLYLKPVLTQNGEVLWAQGSDRLATSGSGRVRDLFPAFRPAEATITPNQTLATDLGTWTYRVYLPAGYEENTLHHYPVLYMMDGQNLFFPRGFGGHRDWGLQDTLEQLNEMTCVESVIVVGVHPNDREADYAHQPGSPHVRFLAEHLKPHIDATYRTLRAAEDNAILGSSLGGVAALACAWQYPEVFGMAGSLSASFGYADTLAEHVLEGERPPIRIYLDSGWPRDNYEVTRDLRARLVRAGFVEGVDLLYFVFPGDRHGEQAWGARCHVPFQFFFGHRPDERSSAGQFATGNGKSRIENEGVVEA
jgi:predicted alpha/beta superfamily hydrolase